jgi:hypothetical protein
VNRRNPIALPLACAALLVGSASCIERKLAITTVPEGAIVVLNDQEVGPSPVTVPFTWYGNYDVVCRKPGYETLKTNFRINAPWYQWPGIDLVAECFVPYTVRDRRGYHFVLDPESPPSAETLVGRASEFREQALFQEK